MTDPYNVLEIDRNADDTQIKKAYRKLSRKYHPDANLNNPNKAQAEEKFKEVQAAYEQIMREREQGYTGRSNSGTYDGDYQNQQSAGGYAGQGDFGGFGDFGDFFGFGGFGGQSQQQDFGGFDNRDAQGDTEYASHMQAASNYIRNGMFQEAIHVLGGIARHTAQWYYFSALAHSGQGNNVTAQQYAKQAAAMEPGNARYQQLYAQMQRGENWYQQQGSNYDMPTFGGGFCFKFLLLNLICSLCCGNSFCCFPGGYYGGRGI